MIAVNFSFQGTELVGIRVSENPEKTIEGNSTVWRILVFFVLSIFILAGLFPWRQAGVIESPFVVVFDKIGILYDRYYKFRYYYSSTIRCEFRIICNYSYAMVYV